MADPQGHDAVALFFLFNSDPQEDLPPVHPVQDRPEHDQAPIPRNTGSNGGPAIANGAVPRCRTRADEMNRSIVQLMMLIAMEFAPITRSGNDHLRHPFHSISA